MIPVEHREGKWTIPVCPEHGAAIWNQNGPEEFSCSVFLSLDHDCNRRCEMIEVVPADDKRVLEIVLRELVKRGEKVGNSRYSAGDSMDFFLAALNQARAILGKR